MRVNTLKLAIFYPKEKKKKNECDVPTHSVVQTHTSILFGCELLENNSIKFHLVLELMSIRQDAVIDTADRYTGTG